MPINERPTLGPLGIYYDRWLALDTLIAESAEHYRRETFDRRKTVLRLLKSLQEFAAGQFQFFYYGYDPADPQRSDQDPLLAPWDEFPAEDILFGIIDQIGHDLELIRRAADQRILGKHNANVRRTLEYADQLAWHAVHPAIHSQVVEQDTTVLTYFEKSAEFYRIPYASVALIAIPFTCTSTTNHSDFLAIPHEVGHYVYRRLMSPVQTQLKNQLEALTIPADYKDWVHAVFEEMCADIYGCLIGGPVMALDFEGLSLANSQADFQVSDGQHPNAALRPRIYCQVLNSLSIKQLTKDDWRPIAMELDRRWNQQLLQRHVTDYVVKTSHPEGQNQLIKSQPYSLAETFNAGDSTKSETNYGVLGNIVHEVVDAVISLVLVVARQTNPPLLQGWAGTIGPKTTSTDLFTQYEREFVPFVKQLKEDDPLPSEADLSEVPTSAWRTDYHSSPLWRKWLKDANSDISDAQISQFWIDWIKAENPVIEGGWPLAEQVPSGEVKDAHNLQPGTWGSILYADGWTTGGPGIDGGHPAV